MATKKKRRKKGEREKRGEEKEREISETSAANHKNFVACILTLFSGFLFLLYSGLWSFPGEDAPGAPKAESASDSKLDTESSA